MPFKNMTYALSAACPVNSVTFVKGKAEEVLEGETIVIAVTHIAYGDLDGDGRDEAAVVTECSSGEHGYFDDEHVFTMDGDHPRQLGRVDGEDNGVESATVKSGALIVERTDGPRDGEDEFYRHGRVVRTVYRWNGTHFARQGKPKVIQKRPPGPR